MSVLLVVALLLLSAARLQSSRVVRTVACARVGLAGRLQQRWVGVAVCIVLVLGLLRRLRAAAELGLQIEASKIAVQEAEHVTLELLLGDLQQGLEAKSARQLHDFDHLG